MFDLVDTILLVDNAQQPMQATATASLHQVASAGHTGKLAVCFTHFELVKGRNLRSFNDRRDHVLGSLEQAIGSFADEYGRAAGRALASRGRMLLILDNFEQIVELGPATLSKWAFIAPDVRFLVTSRELLRLDGEMCHQLAPLPVPSPGDDVDNAEAVKLFVDRGGERRRLGSRGADRLPSSRL